MSGSTAERQASTNLFSATCVCPRCHSTEWKSASLIHAEGFSISNTRTRGRARGVGVGFAGVQAGFGSYTGKTRGDSQTLLSGMATPPKLRTGVQTFLVVLIGFAVAACLINLLSDAPLAAVGSAILGILLLPPLVGLHVYRANAYKIAMQRYAATRLCLRCGTFYVA